MNYHYASDTGELLGESPTTRDQDGNTIEVAFSTLDAPPAHAAGYAPVYRLPNKSVPAHGRGGAWEQVLDHRGPYWLADRIKHVITALGVARPTGALLAEPEPLPPTEVEVLAGFESAITAYLNTRAREKGYETILSAALRAGYPGPYYDEGVVAATWMDNVWHYCYTALAEVKAGTRPQPTVDQLILELPILVWPE